MLYQLSYTPSLTLPDAFELRFSAFRAEHPWPALGG
jgi:hypothetical protein